MHPIRLNLLSPQKKTYLRRMSRFQFTKSIFEILLITASVSAIILLGSQSVLQTYFAELTRGTTFARSFSNPEKLPQGIFEYLMEFG